MPRSKLTLAGGIAGLAVVLSAAWAPAVAAISDTDTVFCLSQAQRPHLIEAAVSLGLARPAKRPDRLIVPPGRELTVDDWNRSRGPDFQRACTALVGASKALVPIPSPGPSRLESTLLVLLPALVGAFLTGVGAIWHEVGVRGRSQAQRLRSSTGLFVQAAEAYLRAWTDTSGDAEQFQGALLARQLELQSVADDVAAFRPGWQAPKDLQTLVSSDQLGMDLTVGWHTLEDPGRGAKASRIREQLDRIKAATEQIAQALERPRRPHPRMRAVRPSQQGHATEATEA